METNLDANIDHWIKYSCHYRGDYYITAVIGKDDVSYLKIKPPKEINLKKIKSFCKGYEKIMIASGSDALRFSAEKQMKFRERYGKAYSEFTDWHVGCGRAAVYSIYKKHKVFNNELDNFFYYDDSVASGQNTISMWLELTKSLK